MSACRSDACEQGDKPCPTPELCNAPDWFDRLLARIWPVASPRDNDAPPTPNSQAARRPKGI
jgi:hypothetical protein